MRLLFCPLATPGFLYPAIGLALSLRARGHDVAFATDVSSASLLAPIGLQRLPRGHPDGPSFEVRTWHHPLSIALQLKHVESALETFPADLLVTSQLALGPLLVRERRHLPVAVQGLCTYLWPTADDPNSQIPVAQRQRRAWRLRDMLGHLARARAIMQLPEPGEPGANIPELEGPEHLLPPGVHLVGDGLWEPDLADPELDRWLDEGTRPGFPVVYVQHGRSFSTPGFWTQFRDALADCPVRVAGSVGRMDDPPPNPIPEGFLLRSHLPQARVLAHAAAVVASANSTAVLGALSHGVPLLLIPGGGEQVDVAERCAGAGVAITVSPETLTASALTAAIHQLLDRPAYRDRARLLAAAFQAKREENRALALVESLADGAGSSSARVHAGAIR
jgi:UDP:flavonoid glycosyltransferase YjiC (YdhE family)